MLLMLWIAADSRAAQDAAGWRCTTRDVQCHSFIVVHNAWHAAMVFDKDDLIRARLPELADFPAARFIEISWGDKDYFPDPDAGVLTALKAAFWSSGSVLHLVGFTSDVEKFYPSAELVELRVTAQVYGRLLDHIAHSFARSAATGRAPARPGLFAYSRFYTSNEIFSLMKTCNTWIAYALQSAGLPISPGLVLTAGQLAEQLDGLKTPSDGANRSSKWHRWRSSLASSFRIFAWLA